MIDWREIDTVLLDMDGTLLDLHYDNYFWQEVLPRKWAEMNGLEVEAAKSRLLPHFRRMEGTLSWYCVDYWSDYLKMDILTLNEEIEHLIRIRPHVEEFLQFVSGTNKPMAMVTNAHGRLIDLKFRYTGIGSYFRDVFCAHDFGLAKEETGFWAELHRRFTFDPARTLLIDDNLAVLETARDYGIRHLLAITRPDSSMPQREIRDFRAIDSFRDLLNVPAA